MSNSDDSTDNQQEQMEYYCIPRKFVFDVPDDNSNPQKEDPKKRALKKSLEAEKYMPFIFSFPEPANYKDSYTLLIKQLLGVYNHIRLLIVEEYYEELKHIIKDIKIEQPGDCLNMLKELLTGCCEKIQTKTNDGSEANGSDSVKDYEELLQKAEAKIRVLIRNEQIFRLNFDILSQKCEDADKSIQAVNQELEASKKIRETMTKENLELVSKLKVKDEEIRKAHKERDVVEKKLKEAADNLAAIDNLDQAGGDPKNLTQSWNQQLLNMLVKEKFTPSETSSRPPSNFDGKGFGGIKQSSSRLTPTDRAKGDKKSNVGGNANLLSTSSGNLNKMQVDRLKSSLIADFKKHMNANLSLGTNRAVLNASLDVMLNKSTEQSHSQERNSVSGAMLSAKKRNSQQIKMGQSQDQIRMKPPMREKKSVENNEREVASYIANKSSTLQKIITTGNKQGTSSTRPTSTGKSRGSPLVSKSRVVQTEQSPDNKSQESRILYTYASNQSTDMVTGAYSGNPKKKSAEPRDSKNQVKGSAKSSLLIKNMIAEQLSKKLGNKAV